MSQLGRLTRALRTEAERWARVEDDYEPKIERSFALTSSTDCVPHVEGFRIVLVDPVVRGRAFTVTITEERRP